MSQANDEIADADADATVAVDVATRASTRPARTRVASTGSGAVNMLRQVTIALGAAVALLLHQRGRDSRS